MTTPVPNLRRPEWLDRLLRQAKDDMRPRNRRRTVKRVVMTVLTMAAIGVFKEAAHLVSERMGWTAPPGRSGDRLGAERVERGQ